MKREDVEFTMPLQEVKETESLEDGQEDKVKLLLGYYCRRPRGARRQNPWRTVRRTR